MKHWKNGIILPLALLLLWWLLTKYKIFSPYLLPSPQTTFVIFGQLCLDGTLWQNIYVSLARVFAGFFCACAVALPLGIICGRSRYFSDFCWPTLEFLRHVPPLASIPLIILWFGIDEASKLVIIFLASFFPLFLNTYSGIKNCDKKLLEVGSTLHFTAWQKARYIQLPAALPSITVGLQLSLGYSWRALIGAELIAASSGIGYMILDAEQMSRPDIVLVGILCIGIIGSIMDWSFMYVTKLLMPWQENSEA
ncbi:MAG: ABC transporter permease [Acidaminococcaceae bacterium]|nr:ABC transporter permease [Acidaminococcaceae bacterium]